MRLKATAPFRDKETGGLIAAGSVFERDAGRAQEIVDAGVAVAAPDDCDPKPKATARKRAPRKKG